jgi:hypothetical protein
VSDSSSAIKDNSVSAGIALKQDYQEFLHKAATLFPKVDQKLLMNILYYENTYSDWEGNMLLKVVYPAGTDMDRKKRVDISKISAHGLDRGRQDCKIQGNPYVS